MSPTRAVVAAMAPETWTAGKVLERETDRGRGREEEKEKERERERRAAAFVCYQPVRAGFQALCLPHECTQYWRNVGQLLWQMPWDASHQDCSSSGAPGRTGLKTISIHIGTKWVLDMILF